MRAADVGMVDDARPRAVLLLDDKAVVAPSRVLLLPPVVDRGEGSLSDAVVILDAADCGKPIRDSRRRRSRILCAKRTSLSVLLLEALGRLLDMILFVNCCLLSTVCRVYPKRRKGATRWKRRRCLPCTMHRRAPAPETVSLP